MRYAVIVCPSCGKARGVESERKTTTCQCGKEIDVQKTRFHYETDSPMDLANAVAQANALILGGEKVKREKRSKKKDPFAEVAERSKAFKDPLERLKAVAKELTASGGDFGVEELKRGLASGCYLQPLTVVLGPWHRGTTISEPSRERPVPPRKAPQITS